MSALLDRLHERGVLSALDVAFARTLGRLAGESAPPVLLGAALASRAVAQGHVCLHLGRLIGAGPLRDESGAAIEPAPWPDEAAWWAALRASPLVGGASADSTPAPLVSDGGRLYLRRYWLYETALAVAIAARATATLDDLDEAVLADGLERLFPRRPDVPSPNPQRLAACIAVVRRFCVISGGPGTGKTHTVVRILALLIEQTRARGRAVPRVALLAPTGKAAARLQESIRAGKYAAAEDGTPALDCDPAVRDAIPETAATIHRALGARLGGRGFRHHRDNPLRVDVVLVDEASMVDLALMARLFDALPATARVILLGDQDQLASVEAGAVLGDVCNSGAPRSPSVAFAARLAALSGEAVATGPAPPAREGIWDGIVTLTHSYRYRPDGGIGRLARAINAGDAAAVRAALQDEADPDVQGIDTVVEDELPDAVRDVIAAGLVRYAEAPTPRAQLAALDAFRVLCAHRRGPGGVDTLNAQIETLLAARGVLQLDGEWYLGRPILITQNDYALRLFNGDVGIIAAHPDEPDRRQALFLAPDGSERRLSPARLPPHETVFAMSVHKSQGSEFDAVAVVLPPQPSPVVSRELLYTAITRARRAAWIVGPRAVVDHAVATPVARHSGLRERLWGAAPVSGRARGRRRE